MSRLSTRQMRRCRAVESAGGVAGEGDAADFLRDALSQGPCRRLGGGDGEQDRPGLLRRHQRLRQGKVFRMARQALGVLYRREGFGTGARYVLSLPAASCAPSNPMRAPLQDRAHMHSQGAHRRRGTALMAPSVSQTVCIGAPGASALTAISHGAGHEKRR